MHLHGVENQEKGNKIKGEYETTCTLQASLIIDPNQRDNENHHPYYLWFPYTDL